MSVTVMFSPDRITVTAGPGERLLNVSERAGMYATVG